MQCQPIQPRGPDPDSGPGGATWHLLEQPVASTDESLSALFARTATTSPGALASGGEAEQGRGRSWRGPALRPYQGVQRQQPASGSEDGEQEEKDQRGRE